MQDAAVKLEKDEIERSAGAERMRISDYINFAVRLAHLEEELRAQRFILEKMLSLLEMKFEAISERFKAMDERFESLQREMNARFKAMDDRFEAMDKRFEALQREMNNRFKAMDDRFEALERRLTHTTWIIGMIVAVFSLAVSLISILTR